MRIREITSSMDHSLDEGIWKSFKSGVKAGWNDAHGRKNASFSYNPFNEKNIDTRLSAMSDEQLVKLRNRATQLLSLRRGRKPRGTDTPPTT